MSLLSISNVYFEYEGAFEPVFENLSLQLDTQWRLGLIGRNGRGKTTLLKLLSGELSPIRGSITGGGNFRRFPFPVQNPSLPALEVAEQACPGYEFWELCREVSLLGLAEETLFQPFDTLSGGEQVKVLLGALFLNREGYLLIDEPTNHLDLTGRELLARYLNGKQGFLLVSHDRAVLDGCTDHILSLNREGIELQKGNFSSWEENRRRQNAFEKVRQEKLEKEVSRLGEAARRTSGWSDSVEKTKYATKNSGLRPDRGYIGHKSAKMAKRAKAVQGRREKALEEAKGLLKNQESTEELKLSPLAFHGRRLIEAKDVTVFYGEKAAFPPVSFTVEQGERIALAGKNGCGKSTLLKLICGQPLPYAGEFFVPKGLTISYLPQHTDHLSGTLAAFEREHGLDASLFRAILRKLDFSREQFDKRLEEYSAGQKKKVLLAKSLCEPAHLYVWDEPLNFIDLFSRMQIEELIKASGATMVLVEHDRAFLDRCATRVISLPESEEKPLQSGEKTVR